MIDTERSRQALALFDELLDLAPGEQAARLQALAATDPELHARVARLLAGDAVGSGLLERDPSRLFPDGEDAPEEEDPLLGQRIGPWRITGIVGRGGMGAVYRGEREDGEFRQQAALKLIRLGLDRPDLRRRFLRERQLLAQLQHPNIATLLDGGVDERGAPYFAMELVDGLPVDQWCDEHRQDVRERVRLFLQVCAAVQHAHQHLAVHRDLKPGNILVTASGQAKLLDFGIAKLLADDAGDTQTRDRPLTPEFAAPEQLHGAPITTATDQYALGLVLYRLLAAAPPFAAGDGDSWRHRLAAPDREPEPISRVAARATPEQAQARRLTPPALAAALRGDLAAIVHRCLQAEPDRRYASIDALTADLKAWLDGRPVNARLGHRGYRVRKFVARHRWGVAAGVAALLAIGGALVVAVQQATEARRQAALASANALRAEANAARALSTRDFAVSLLNSASAVKNARGTQTTAAELLEAAAQRVDEELVDAPAAQAELRTTIGAGLYQQGAHARGIELINSGIAQMQQLGVGGVQLVEALQARAIAERERGDDDSAERDIQAALAMLPRLPGDQRLRAIKLRTSMATIANQRGRLREALAINQANLRDRTALLGEGHEDTAVDWNNLGYAHMLLDHFPQAEAAFQRADDILAAAKGRDFPRRTWTLMGVGSARLGQGSRLGLAEAAYAEAERVLRSSLGEGHPMGLNLQVNRATLDVRRGRCDLAIPVYAAALARARDISNPQADQIEGSLGSCLLEQGDTPAALAHLETAVAGLARDRAASEPTLNRMQAALGLARFRSGRQAQGEREIRAALARLQTAGFDHTDDYAEAAAGLAAVLEATGDRQGAREWQARAHRVFAEVYGADHPRTRLAAAMARGDATEAHASP